MSPHAKSALIRRRALGLGFSRVGIVEAKPIDRADYLHSWLAAGRAGRMDYLKRNTDIRTQPAKILDGARSIIVTATNYHRPTPPRPTDHPTGRVARYAWGSDYHRVVRQRLRRLVELMTGDIEEPYRTRICVDTAPILERELAAAAGVGWIGKNTMVLHQDEGSYFFLGSVVTTLELEPDGPAVDHCGSCRKCLDACPTQAFPAPYQMDASRCISYLTIELREEIPKEFHQPMGDWLFGCDICQEVCPFNHKAPTTDDPEFRTRESRPYPNVADILTWTPTEHEQWVKDSAMDRATLPMLQRNAQVVKRNKQSS